MRLSVSGVYAKHKKLASGQVRTYYYHRESGQRLPDDPQSPAFFSALASVKSRPRGKRVADRTVAHLIRQFRASSNYAELKSSTRSEYKRHLDRIEPILGAFSITSIKRAHLESLNQKFADRPSTARAVETVIKLLFSFAADRLGWIEINPFLGMNRRRKRPETGQRPYTEKEIATFRATHGYGSRARLVFEIGLGTAFRISDIVRFPASAMTEQTFPICTLKTGELVHVPVTIEMRRAWNGWQETMNASGIAPGRMAVCNDDGSEMHKRTLSKDMAHAYTAAGFEASQRTHALRYTACVRLIENGFSYEDVAEHTGHRLAAMAAKYCAKRRSAEDRGSHFDQLDGHALTSGEGHTNARRTVPEAMVYQKERSLTLPKGRTSKAG